MNAREGARQSGRVSTTHSYAVCHNVVYKVCWYKWRWCCRKRTTARAIEEKTGCKQAANKLTQKFWHRYFTIARYETFYGSWNRVRTFECLLNGIEMKSLPAYIPGARRTTNEMRAHTKWDVRPRKFLQYVLLHVTRQELHHASHAYFRLLFFSTTFRGFSILNYCS